MSTEPQIEHDPIVVKTPGWRNDRYQFWSKGGSRLDFGSVEEPHIIAVPAGITQLLLQERRCGDFYAEIEGAKLLKSHVSATAVGAVEALFAQVPA
jgi:hypothetical protein